MSQSQNCGAQVVDSFNKDAAPREDPSRQAAAPTLGGDSCPPSRTIPIRGR
jgi:hypothetical protein